MLKMTSLIIALALGVAGCAQDDPTVGQQQQQPEPAGPETVAVTMVEYEFQGIPETVAAGETTFTVENTGEEQHELALVRIVTETPIEELIELPEKKAQAQIEDAGHAFAKPGRSAELEAELEAGRYGYVCFIPAPDGTPHAFLGMLGEFTVA
jgi:uncharacterized cupredoxin-like copper-binding protein